jgi:6-pyruvoyl-tetrahydropterin synthase
LTAELSIAKKFNFCAARRFYRPDWSDEQNYATFGDYSIGKFGFGQNFVLWVDVSGPIQPDTGMIVPLEVIKSRVANGVLPQFDHHLFSTGLPLTEKLCVDILTRCREQLSREAYQVSTCTLHDGDYSVIASPDHQIKCRFRIQIIALPQALVVKGQSEHLIYPCTLTVEFAYDALHSPLTHSEAHFAWTQHIQEQLDVFAEQVHMMAYPAYARLRYPTLEAYAVAWWPRLLTLGNVSAIELTSLDGQFCRYTGGEDIHLSVSFYVSATHCLKDPGVSCEENEKKFGKCARHHGHRFLFTLQTTHLVSELTKSYIPRILEDYLSVKHEFDALSYRSITHESALLGDQFGTCESILTALAARLTSQIPLSRLSVLETENNLITLRQ